MNEGGGSVQRIIVMAATMTRTITVTMIATRSGLLIMCRKSLKRAYSGRSLMPHVGQ